MNREYIQQLKSKLDRRFIELKNVRDYNFEMKIKHFWHFLNSDSTYLAILNTLELKNDENILKTYKDILTPGSQTYFTSVDFGNEAKQLEFYYLIFEGFINNDRPQNYIYLFSPNVDISLRNNLFVEECIKPVYEYISEQLDQNNLVLGLVKRYKYKCEWFLRKKIEEQIGNYDNTKIEEQVLAPHLYEYLHDQGLDNLYEVKSGDNGRLDFRSNLNQGYQFIGEVKLYKTLKLDILVGFKELVRHLNNNDINFGYLIIFNIGTKDGKSNYLELDIDKLIVGDKTIIPIIIDIRKDKPIPSSRGEKAVTITEKDFIDSLNKS